MKKKEKKILCDILMLIATNSYVYSWELEENVSRFINLIKENKQ